MNTADKIKVMQAYLDGAEIEYNGGSGWITQSKAEVPCWDWTLFDYRISEQNYSLDIPWEWLEDKWQYAAMDEDGEIYFFTEHPNMCTDYWTCPATGAITRRGCLKIKKPDRKHWKQTLAKRPKGE